MAVICNYKLTPNVKNIVKMSRRSRILSAAAIGDEVYVYVLHPGTEQSDEEEVQFYVAATGIATSDCLRCVHFLGTVVLYGGSTVLHVFHDVRL